MNLSTLISVAHAGGQGKTTLSQLIYVATQLSSIQYKLIAADFLDESGRSKLGKLYPDQVEEFGIGADLTAARTENNPNAALRYWDKFGAILLSGGHIVDVGANVITPILHWAHDRQLGTLLDKRRPASVEFLCICKAEKHAIDDMSSLITKLSDGRPFRNSRFIIVMNEAGGSFGRLDLQGQLRMRFPGETIDFVTLPKCQSEIWPQMEKYGVSISEALELDEEEAISKLDVDLWTASAGLAELRVWFDHAVSNLADAGILPRATQRALADRKLARAS